MIVNWLHAIRQKVHSLVGQINETAEDSLSVYLTPAAFALSVLNSVAMIIACKCIYRVVLRWISQASLPASTVQPSVSVQHTSNSEQPQVACSIGPVRKHRRTRNQAQNWTCLTVKIYLLLHKMSYIINFSIDQKFARTLHEQAALRLAELSVTFAAF